MTPTHDDAVAHALAAVVKDSDRISDLLDELSRGRLWLPLPDDGGPVTDGSAVQLPTVIYLGSEFVPAFTSADLLASFAGVSSGAGQDQADAAPDRAWTQAAGPYGGWTAQRAAPPAVPRQASPVLANPAPANPAPANPALTNPALTNPAVASTVMAGPGPASMGRHASGAPARRTVPHVVVPTAELARRMPPGVGIALNPGAAASVPIYPEGVTYLAAAEWTAGDVRIRLGQPPTEPECLLREISAGLRPIRAVRYAARAWLSVPGAGEGLIISVTLDDPAGQLAQQEVLSAIAYAADVVGSKATFPIDVTFPGEHVPDDVDRWIADQATPFHLRA
jgi:SseB protein N-terminal domain